jgi:hypothetical protein
VKPTKRQRLRRASKLPSVCLLTAVALLFVGSIVWAGVTGTHPAAAPTSVVTHLQQQ